MKNQLLISSPENAIDIHYICGIQPPEEALLLKKGASPILIVSKMEYNRLNNATSKKIKVIHPEMIGSSWKKGPVDWIKKINSKEKRTEIQLMSACPVELVEKFREEGFKITIRKKPVCPQREIKTAEETKAIQRAQRAAVAAMKAAIQQISKTTIGRGGALRLGKTTLTSEDVRKTIGHTLLDLGCHASETIVSCGPASADPHERGEGPLFAGQPIVIDIFPRLGTCDAKGVKTGYWGDITRTVCRGPAPAALKKQYAAVKAAQAAQLKMLKAGVRADVVHSTGAELMESRGFKTETVNGTPQGFIHGTGHGVGLEIHEAPRVSPANRKTLKAGHIVTIEPGLYYPQLGGVRIEDTVLVTKDGYKMLCPCPKKLEI